MTAPVTRIYSILGVAGAGKTTQLIDLLKYLNYEDYKNRIWEDYFEQTELNNVAFISFSNTAIQEIANRTGIKVKDRRRNAEGRYFRTVTGLLEVLLYENNLMSREEVQSVSRLEDFRVKWAKRHGMYYKPRDNDIRYTGNEFFAEYSRLINTYYHKKSLNEIIGMHSKAHLLRDYLINKKREGIMDYEDILMRAYDYKDDIVVDLQYMIIDEAQDNSILDYATLLTIARNNLIDVVLAGDDAQLIYDFRGANYVLFNKLIENSKIILNLTQTHRFGSELSKLATSILNDMKYIQQREISSANDIESYIMHVKMIQVVKLLKSNKVKDMTIYILARTNAVLDQVAKILEQKNIYYIKNERFTDFDRFILSISRLLRNEYTNEDIYTIFNYMRNKSKNEEELKEKVFQHRLMWTEQNILDILMTAYDIETAKRILDIAKNSNFRLKLSTVHSAKGSEADIVILINSIPAKTKMKLNFEQEKRVLYVAVTRARKWLLIVDEQLTRKYTKLYYLRTYERVAREISEQVSTETIKVAQFSN